jgi:hypothetical protein
MTISGQKKMAASGAGPYAAGCATAHLVVLGADREVRR